MIGGLIFRKMIRIQARQSELQAESRSYGTQVGVTAGQTPRIRTESPRKGPEWGSRCFYREPPLNPSWIHLRNAIIEDAILTAPRILQKRFPRIMFPLLLRGHRIKGAGKEVWISGIGSISSRQSPTRTSFWGTLWHEIITKIIFILHPRNLQERRTFSRNYVWNS